MKARALNARFQTPQVECLQPCPDASCDPLSTNRVKATASGIIVLPRCWHLDRQDATPRPTQLPRANGSPIALAGTSRVQATPWDTLRTCPRRPVDQRIAEGPLQLSDAQRLAATGARALRTGRPVCRSAGSCCLRGAGECRRSWLAGCSLIAFHLRPGTFSVMSRSSALTVIRTAQVLTVRRRIVQGWQEETARMPDAHASSSQTLCTNIGGHFSQGSNHGHISRTMSRQTRRESCEALTMDHRWTEQAQYQHAGSS